MLFIIFTTLVVLYLITCLWKRRNLPPGPMCLPIVGYLPWLDPKAPYETLTNLSKKYGEIYGLYLGSVYTVVLTNPKTIRSVFNKDAASGRAPLYLTHGIMQGYGLICAQGDLWKDQRKFVYNCLRNFGGTKIGSQRKNMEKLIMKQALETVKYLEDFGKDSSLDPLETLRHSIGSAVNLIVFGKSYDRNDELWKWLQWLQEEGTQQIGVAGPLNFLPFLRFVPHFKKTINFILGGKIKTHKVYQKIIDEQSEMLKQMSYDTLEQKQNNVSNVLQAFLVEREKRKGSGSLEKYYNDQQFYHLLADLFGAGLDTTLTTLRWFLLYIAKYKDIQRKLKDEINQILQNRLVSLEDMASMPLMEAAISETQRIRPVVPVGIPHGSLSEIQIQSYNIPKNTMIVPLQWAVHMNEKVWINPETFNPFRFLDNEGKVVKSEHFIPFQSGKRMCVGDELAKMILFLFGATILQKFDLELENENSADFQGLCGITLTPKPHKIYFKTP